MRWLDMVLWPRPQGIHIATSMPELAWVMLDAEQPRTFRLPPYVGETHIDHSGIRAHIHSRLSRWSQLRLAKYEIMRALTYEILIFLRSGYPPQLIVQFWTSHAGDHRQAELVRATAKSFATWYAEVQAPCT